ncbi:MAG TPA: hypothetical protein VF281_03260 [Candidatus Saccharimonadales bacterium]
MTNALFSGVDKMPFAGKFAIRESISNYIEADADKEKKQYLKTSAYLGMMAVAHAYQSYMGYETLTNHVEDLANTGDSVNNLLVGVDALYTIVNAGVATRQIALVKWVGEIRKKKLAQQESVAPKQKAKEKDSKTNDFLRKQILAATAITLAGQALFAGSFIDGNIKEAKNNCVETATQIYNTYDEQHPDEDLVPLTEFTNDFCN